MRNHRITMSDFRPCSACRPRSQAPLCHCTPRAVANRAEGTFESLRYAFGGDHPSQTTRQTPSPLPWGLGPAQAKGGISTSAPRSLARPAPSLPPILHSTCASPMLSCSEGSRGLSVPLRVNGIFTVTSISPSSWLRAGRNLPDKEFRYLRTVIVTAAVYRGFNSGLPSR